MAALNLCCFCAKGLVLIRSESGTINFLPCTAGSGSKPCALIMPSSGGESRPLPFDMIESTLGDTVATSEELLHEEPIPVQAEQNR